MSNQNSAVSDTECECGFYSECWEESVVPINKELVDFYSESDLCLHPNNPCSLFEKEKQKSKIVLISGNNQTNFKNCCRDHPLLQVQNLDTTREFQVELLPESILHFNFKDYHTHGNPSKTISSMCHGSCRDHLCLNTKIPHVIVTENFIKEQILKEAYALDKPLQKQSPSDYHPSSKHNKAVQVFFPCRETKARENIVCQCFRQSAIPAEVNKTPVQNLTRSRSNESQLVEDNLVYSSERSYKIDNPQTAEKIHLHTSSGELIISLTLEAAYVDPADSVAGNISDSKDRVGKEDSQKHSLAFQFKGPEHNQLFKKLCISIVPRSVHLGTEKQKQTTPLTKERGLSQILVGETSQPLGNDTEASETSHPLATSTESSESSSSDINSDQVLSTLKSLSPGWLYPTLKHTDENQSPHFFVSSLPHYKVAPAYRTIEVQKGQPKSSRLVKSVVFTPQKAQKDQKYRSKALISKFHWPKALDVETINKNSPKREEINDPYVPLTQTTKCSCSPLLDLTVDLYSSERDSEKLFSVPGRPHKRTGGGKITRRFSSRYLLNPKSNFERFKYISPKTNNLKMQNILNYCLGWAGGQNTHKNCKGEACPTPDSSNTQGNKYFTPCSLINGRSSTAPLLPSSRHSPVPLPTALPLSNERRHSPVPCLQPERRSPAALYLLPNEQRHSHAPCMQTERDTWSPATSYSDCKCSISHSPCCANVVKVVQLPKERNVFNNICMEKLDYGADQVACGGLALKKFSVCPCGNVPQCGLFPSGDISETVRKKTRASPDINWRASMTESNRVNSPIGTFNTEEACCASCHHGFPSCSLYNTDRYASRNQFIKLASFFENGLSTKKLKEDVVEKSKAMKTGERKNVSFHVGPSARDLQEIGPSGLHTASPNDGCQTPKHFVYRPECSCCENAVKEHCGTSGKVHNCFASECKMLKNCLNRESIFLVDPGQRTRSQCKCCQEIPLFNINPTNIYKGNRAAISKRKESDLIQDSSQINHGWKIFDGNHKCC